MERWSGRVAVVTGASQGIGACIARTLVAEGLTVVGLARSFDLLQELAKELAGTKGKLIPRKCDLTSETDIDEMFQWLEKSLGGADVFINCAGIMDNTPLLDAPTSIWRQMLDVNVLALTICSKHAANSMLARGVDDGHIININSLMGHMVLGNLMPFYTATKWAVTALCKSLQNELCIRESHIRVTSVCPGLTETGMTSGLLPNKKEVSLRPEDVADAVIYALSSPPAVIIQEVKIAPNQGSVGHVLSPTRH